MSEQSPDQTATSDMSAADAIEVAFESGVAAAITGGFDGSPGKPFDPSVLPPNCLNCGALVRGRYCIDCGQNTNTHVPTLVEVLGDGIVSLFNLDSRLWRTLGVLLFRPGLQTQDFLAGRRARYVPPLRLYLVMSVFLFLVLALGGDRDNDADEREEIEEAISAEVAAATAALPADEAQAIRDDVSAQVAEELAAVPFIQSEDDPDPDLRPGPGLNFTVNDDGEVTISDAEGNDIEVEDGRGCEEMDVPYWDKGDRIDTAVREACRDAIEDNFSQTWEDFRDNIPLMAFLVIPLMAAVFKLFYAFTGRPYLAHLIFLCHTHAYTFLMIMGLTLLNMIGNTVGLLNVPFAILGGVWLLLYTPAYYFMAMRRVYGQGVLLTLVKLPILMLAYFFVASLVFMFGFLAAMLIP